MRKYTLAKISDEGEVELLRIPEFEAKSPEQASRHFGVELKESIDHKSWHVEAPDSLAIPFSAFLLAWGHSLDTVDRLVLVEVAKM